MKRLLHILPRIPPAICGVGDQTTYLAETLFKEHGINSLFLPAGHELAKPQELWPKLEAQLEAIDAVTIQYSCYGFQKRGIPFHLIRTIKRLRLSHPRLPVLTMFHELAASGPITSSAFWLGRIQRSLVGRLARLSTAVRTNRVAYKKELESLAPAHAGKIVSMPIFSNFGETANPLPIEQRNPTLVLFQPPPYDKTQPNAFWKSWERLRDHLQPTETIIAGRAKALPEGPDIRPVGVVSADEAAQLLAKSAWGLVDYFPGYIGKSSLFAGFAGHGIATFTPADICGADEGLFAGRHYTITDSTAPLPNAAELQTRATELHQWYQPHSQKATAESYIRQLDILFASPCPVDFPFVRLR